MNGDLRRRLEDAGVQPMPDPDPAFVDDLEARLRSVAAGLPTAHEPPPRRGGLPFGRRAAGAGLALVAVALVVAVGVSVLGTPTAPGAAPTLGHPVNVEVALADGTILEDPDGLVLPEGAVVTVGAGGSARIGDTVLTQGDVATVRDGHLDLEAPQAGVVATPDRSLRPADRPATLAPSIRPGSTPAPTGTPARSPGSTTAPSAKPGGIVTPGATSRPATAAPAAPSATPATAVVRPRVRARLIAGPRIAVTWTPTLRAHSYVLLVTRSRSGPARDPVYPGSTVLGEFAAPPESPLRYRVPPGVVEVRLMVVALRSDGSVLRRSRVVTVTVPPAGDTTGSGSGGTLVPPTSAEPGATPTPSPTPAASATPAPTASAGP